VYSQYLSYVCTYIIVISRIRKVQETHTYTNYSMDLAQLHEIGICQKL